MPDIFLSYNREDQARAKVFAEAFEAQGFNVWWDVGLKTGEAYDEVTESALRAAKAVVVLWSRKSVVSRWVRAEATLADRNKTLVPCMIEACERPIMFELTQTAELGHWQGAADDKAWHSFLADVNRFVQRDLPASAFPAAAPSPRDQLTKASRDEIPSLAIMPFANRSGLPSDDALAYGMVEDIIAAISPNANLRVLASGSTMAWAGKPADLRFVGRELGVRYALEGNVRRAGQNLRVTVQLVETETGAILWTQKFERPLSELADLQEDLVTEMAGRLDVQVLHIEMERALRKPGDINAYEAYQRAVSVFNRLSLDRVPFGIAEARRALTLAPDYAQGHATLAFLLTIQWMWTGGDDALKRESLQHVGKALALEPNDPRMLAVVAGALNYLGQPGEALRHALRAIEINPNIAVPHRFLAIVQLRLGLNDETITSLDSDARLAPGSLTLYTQEHRRADAHFQAGRMELAVEAMERAFRLNPDYPPILFQRAGLCELTGRPEEASDAIRHLRRIEPKTSLDTHVGRYTPRVEATQFAPMIAAFRKVWDETPT